MTATGYSSLEYAQALVQAAQEVVSDSSHDSRDVLETLAESEEDFHLALFGAAAIDLLMRSDPGLEYETLRNQLWTSVKLITDA